AISLGGDLCIAGPGSEMLSVSSKVPVDWIFTVDPGADVSLRGMTITRGRPGGIFNAGDLQIAACNIASNSGRGLANYGTLTVSDSSLRDNIAGGMRGGGIDNEQGTVTVKNSTISGNHGHWGGGILNGGVLTVINSTISDNSADYGGGLYNDTSATATLLNTTVTANRGPGGLQEHTGAGIGLPFDAGADEL